MQDHEHVGTSAASFTHSWGGASPASSSSSAAPAESQLTADGVPANNGSSSRTADADARAAQVLSHWSEGSARKSSRIQTSTPDGAPPAEQRRGNAVKFSRWSTSALDDHAGAELKSQAQREWNFDGPWAVFGDAMATRSDQHQRQASAGNGNAKAEPAASLGGHEVAGKSVHLGNAAAVIKRAPDDPTQTQETSTGQIAFVREDNLNLRSGPGQQTKPLMQLKFGQRVHLLDGSDQGGWRKVAVLGQTGYVHTPKIHFPKEDLINKDPGLSLIKVKPSQTFWGLVKEVYGIQGNETTADQNINHFINAIRAVNKPEAFKVKAGFLDRVSNSIVSGRDASDTELIGDVDLWIPSFQVAAKMDVGSGTVSGEVSRFVKKIDQKLADFSAACGAATKFIPEAIGRNATEMGEGLLKGLLDFALDAAKTLAISTAVGALIGALFGGVGAIPGAEIGFEIGLFILNWYGIYMLVEAVLGIAGNLLSQLSKFISLSWNANGDKAQIEAAGKALAEALGIFVSAVLMALAAYVLKKGSEALLKTKFAKTVGQSRLAQWLSKRQKMTTTQEQLDKPNRPKGEESSHHQEENREESSHHQEENGSGGSVDAKLIEELKANGVKCNPEAIIKIGRAGNGKIVFLEKGSPKAGFEHILNHEAEFAGKGVPREKIPDLIMKALTEGKEVGFQGKPPGRPIFEVSFEGKTLRVAITVGSNGFIVGANPTSF